MCHLTNVENCDEEREGYIMDSDENDREGMVKNEQVSQLAMLASGMVHVDESILSTNEINSHLSAMIQQDLKTTQGEKEPICIMIKVERSVESDDGTKSCSTSQKDVIYAIPRDGKPLNEYANPSHLACLYPNLFPFGCGLVEDPGRLINVGFKAHLQFLLSLEDKRFEKNHSFLYIVFNILQKRNACYGARLLVSRPYFSNIAQNIDKIKLEDIDDVLRCIEDKTYKPTNHKNIDVLLKQIRTIGGEVIGSHQSRASLRVEIHSLIYKLGLPSLFLTINPADTHHPVSLSC